jgi:hypothetical protein
MEHNMRNNTVEASDQSHVEIDVVQQALVNAQKEILELQSQIQWLERSYE